MQNLAASYQVVFVVRGAKALGYFQKAAKLKRFHEVFVCTEFSREAFVTFSLHTSQDFNGDKLKTRLCAHPAQNIETAAWPQFHIQ